MSRCHTVDPSAIDASIHLIADRLLDGLVRGELEPCLLHVRPDGDGVELGVKPLEGLLPTGLLLGFVAPPEWYAFGSATTGKLYDVADRATGAPALHRVHVVTLLTRSGEVVNRTRVEGNRVLGDEMTQQAEDLGGEQVDLLRLALELPTPPPPCGVEIYWTIEWLSGVLAHEGSIESWESVLACHPAMRMLAAAEEALCGDEDFFDAVGAFSRVCTWNRLRQLVEDDAVVVPELAPEDARWLDDGAFSRYLLSRCPPLHMLRQQASDALPPRLAERLDAALDTMGIPGTAWPEDTAA